MIKFLLFVVALLLVSCAAPKFGVERKKVDYFDEWGLFRLTGQNVLSNASGNVSAENLEPEKLCKDFFGYLNVFGARLYSDSSTGNISLECLTMIAPIKSSFTEGVFIDLMIGSPSMEWAKDDSLYYVLYGGNAIMFSPESEIQSRLVCQEERIDSCSLNGIFEKKRKGVYFKGPYYELTMPTNRSFYSTTIITNPENLKGYKPLKLDPSILPLESPGYKRLREQEEALSR